MNIGLGSCLIEHHYEAACLVNEAPLTVKILIFEVEQGRIMSAIYSNLVIAEDADQEQLAMVDLELNQLSEALTFGSDLPDVLVYFFLSLDLAMSIKQEEQIVRLGEDDTALIIFEAAQLSDRRLLITLEGSDFSDELHLLYAPKSQVTGVRDGKELLTVRAEVNEFNSFADLELSNVPEVDCPHMVIGARIVFRVCEVNRQLCFSN